MSKTTQNQWQRFQEFYTEFKSIGLSLDLSKMNFDDGFFDSMSPLIAKAFDQMTALERGAIANPDENRMVGHYWLRNPNLAPTKEISQEIEQTINEIITFSGKIHHGQIVGQDGPFKNLLVIGIGGSALGPQFVSKALLNPRKDKLKAYFLDNTDPDGIDLVLSELDGKLGQTICIVISKSGGTKETRNGMLETKAKYDSLGINFSKHAVAITGRNSQLDDYAKANNWLQTFPMWDWVGGRTSELSAVGLLPACLQGIDIKSLVKGAHDADEASRSADARQNPSIKIALSWYHAGKGAGKKDMVVLPYKDRLELLSKYLQQLIMESIGKEKDLSGKIVNQGLSVFGNKGATDQHSYIQQLREGLNNFFVTFIEVLSEREGECIFVDSGVTSGDYLSGFLLGTRRALYENGRESMTISIQKVDAYSIGVLIALFERAVGFYASMLGINAYHQPGVEAGKKAAEEVLQLQRSVVDFLTKNPKKSFRIEEIASSLNKLGNEETIFKICTRLASNPKRGFTADLSTSIDRSSFKYSLNV